MDFKAQAITKQKQKFLTGVIVIMMLLSVLSFLDDFSLWLLHKGGNLLAVEIIAMIICVSAYKIRNNQKLCSWLVVSLLFLASIYAIAVEGSSVFCTVILITVISIYLLSIPATICFSLLGFLAIYYYNFSHNINFFETIDWLLLLLFTTLCFSFIYLQSQNLVNLISQKNSELYTAREKDNNKKKIGQLVSHKMDSVVTELSTTSKQQFSISREQVESIETAFRLYKQVDYDAISISKLADNITDITANIILAISRATRGTSLAAETAENGQLAIQETATQFQLLRDKLIGLTFTFGFLEDLASNLADISNSVKILAKTIHTLGLSASLEATGRGIEGQRFAKIAEQIKEVATKCSKTSDYIVVVHNDLTKNINNAFPELIESQRAAEIAVKAAEASRKVIDELTSICEISAKEAYLITTISDEQQRLIQNIKISARAQVANASDVKQMLETVVIGSTQTATASQQLTQTAQELETMSHDLVSALAT